MCVLVAGQYYKCYESTGRETPVCISASLATSSAQHSQLSTSSPCHVPVRVDKTPHQSLRLVIAARTTVLLCFHFTLQIRRELKSLWV